MKRLLARLCFLLLISVGAFAQSIPVITVDQPPNSAEQQKKHYVVLVSLDGFRYDYAKKYGATHLLEIAKHGASVPDGMIPSYPSLTFPNHYTLVTGLYPEHHGIVGNEFYDPERKAKYALSDKAAEADGTWYEGTPLWSLAVKQGMRSACFFWPGSVAEIAGARPTYYLRYDNSIPDERRVEQVIAWLKLPAEQRPHFITLYYSKVDHAGHEFGPDSPQVAEAVKSVDATIGLLEENLQALHLPIDLIVVSDHGMAKTDPNWVTLDKYASLDGFVTVGLSLYAPSEAAAEKAYEKLKGGDSRFNVYRRKDVPAELHFNSNPREGDPVVVAKGSWAIRATTNSYGGDKPPNIGNHGFDPRVLPEMKAVFYAEGPDIKPGVQLQSFENVNVFPLIVELLGLDSPKVDGDPKVLSGIVKK
ncbi:Phosphodiesterase I [Candidatus Koribacter versatilis Ellin345]|uniref:Phosphodiesterase I n=1 Tax=Koribacter versatilis (strain Ellin345) TaxID=204669 RepID=Q1IRP9_KORVE|nr:ectonucleotide pyrophosphatase/phosphodiesterase [Candidatus Koribacter versatilis]ABF40451.1 Phosphodiesterase I [Candidatus Koribacter versatilis Ellin345]